jgi:hypothetical protein
MMGGFDKRILAGGGPEAPMTERVAGAPPIGVAPSAPTTGGAARAAIEREVERLAPLVAEGGYIGFCDHNVPPDVPLDNYLFYLEAVRRVWGRGLDLKPLRRP